MLPENSIAEITERRAAAASTAGWEYDEAACRPMRKLYGTVGFLVIRPRSRWLGRRVGRILCRIPYRVADASSHHACHSRVRTDSSPHNRAVTGGS
jgi:hypothetical protein